MTGNGSEATVCPPRESLVRALIRVDPAGEVELVRGIEFRDNNVEGSLGTLTGHFAVFNRWTEIDSFFEGNFMERIAPGAFKKTFREQGDQIKVLFQHGRDTQIGSKPLGPIEELKEDDVGGSYAVPLLDTAYNRELLPGLKAGLYGASFRFSVVREDVVSEPKPSDQNPKGIPERTIKEARVMEFGPVTFPAYAEATAGVRSLTDWFGEGRQALERLTSDSDRLRALLQTEAPAVQRRMTRADAKALLERLDPEGTYALADMIACGAMWVDDETDEADVATMEGILSSLADLLQQEIAEPTPPEDDEDDQPDEMASASEDSDTEEREEGDSEPAATKTQGATPGARPTSTTGALLGPQKNITLPEVPRKRGVPKTL